MGFQTLFFLSRPFIYFVLGWIRDQRATLPEVVNKDLSDKTIVVIGANIGLGLEGEFIRATTSS